MTLSKSTSITLTKEDERKMLERCIAKKYKVIDIFRMGLESALEEIDMGEALGGLDEQT